MPSSGLDIQSWVTWVSAVQELTFYLGTQMCNRPIPMTFIKCHKVCLESCKGPNEETASWGSCHRGLEKHLAGVPSFNIENRNTQGHTPWPRYSLIALCSFPLVQLGQRVVIQMIITLMSRLWGPWKKRLVSFAHHHQGLLWCWHIQDGQLLWIMNKLIHVFQL